MELQIYKILAAVLIAASLLLSIDCRVADDFITKEEPPPPPPSPAPPAPPPRPSVAPPPPPPPPSHTCYRAEAQDCPKDGPLMCRRIEPDAVLCCNVDSFTLKEGLTAEAAKNQTILNIHILNATLEDFDVSHYHQVWRRLISLSITDGKIENIKGEFSKHTPINCLNVSNNGLTSIVTRSLVHLYNLTTLDISNNNLTLMPNFNGRPINFAIDIRGNNGMQCRSVLESLSRYSEKWNFLNVNVSYCTSSKTFHWFNTTELVPIREIEALHELKNDCKVVSGDANCHCFMQRVDIVQGKSPILSVAVDCSNRNLRELPAKLPPNTILLNVSYNNITSLAPLSEHPSYEHVRQLDADFNNIQSIVELEGTKFIDNFMVLSLRSNKLKSLPTYILSNTFDRNTYVRQINLANNHLHCDCTTAKVLKVWLLDKTKQMSDYRELYCEGSKQQPAQRVIDLVESQMCQQQRDWTDYIYYIISAEVLLLLALVSKVSYDYWVFKSAGYLPWPASKMPKLPCDWLCE